MKRYTALGLVLTALLVFGIGSAGPAFAQPRGHCTASTCNGQDPAATGCSVDSADNQTWTSPGIFVGSGTLYLRYSPLCESNWAKFVTDAAGQVTVWVRNANGTYGYFSGSSYDGTSATIWSGMVDGTVAAQACATYQSNVVSGSGCTNWY